MRHYPQKLATCSQALLLLPLLGVCLKKRFGDEDLIAIKLKNELKSLVISAQQDHEKIIALVIKVRSLVTRLD